MVPNKYVLKIFENLLADVQPAHMVTLLEDVQTHLEELREAAKQRMFLSVELAEELAEKLEELLHDLGDLPIEHQNAVVAAARYFISKEDVNSDTQSVLGLDDDVSLFNHVAEEVGRPDLCIQLN